ncbi:MAG: DUF6056 family protein, partial [Fusobacteriaceae bacterium]
MYGVTKNIIRVDSLDKIARTTLTFYFQRGGRVLGIILEQIFLILPKIFFNLFNSTVFLFMLYGIFLNLDIKKIKNNILHIFIIILFLFWFGIPRFGETVIWQGGSLNYLLAAPLFLYFIFYLKRITYTQEIPTGKKSAGILILSFFAGWTVELGVVGVFITSMIYLFSFFKKKQIPFFIYKMLFLFCFGGFLLLSAPGNFARGGKLLITTKYGGTLSEIFKSSISSLKLNPQNNLAMYDKTPNYFMFLRELFSITSILWIIILISIFILIYKKENIKNIFFENYQGLIIFLVGVIAYYAAPYFPMRGIFIPVVFLIIFTIKLFLEALNALRLKFLFNIISLVFSILVILSYFPLLQNYKIENMVAGHIETLDEIGQDEIGKCAGYSYDGWILPFIMETTAKDALFSNFSKKYYDKNIQTRVYTIFLTRNLYFRSGDCGADNFWTPPSKPIFEL